MFIDYDGLIERLRTADPRWRYEMVKELEEKLADHDYWCAEGKPDLDCWIVYKAARTPTSPRLKTRKYWVKMLAERGIADPGPISADELAAKRKRRPAQ